MTEGIHNPSGMAWYRLPNGQWIQASTDDPRWRASATRTHRRRKNGETR